MKRAFPSIMSAIVLVLLFTLGHFAGSGVAYAADGDLDPDFDGDGRVTTDFAGYADRAFAVAVQPDGKIVVAGDEIIDQVSGESDFSVARYNQGGSLDTSFSGDGKERVDFSFEDDGFAMALQPDGKIVLAGSSYSSTTDFAVARLNPNGSLDTSFSEDGKVTTDFAGGPEVAQGIAIQPDGKIVVVGYMPMGVGDNDFAVARYNSDGSLDNSFSGDGRVTTDFVGSYDAAYGVAIQADGKIVAAGSAQIDGSNNDFALARYEVNGTLDTMFGFGGRIATDFAGESDGAYDIAIQADGKIVAAGGATGANSNIDFAVARYNSDATLDTSFSVDGKVTTDFSTPNDQAFGLGVQPDGKIMVGGATFTEFALARYNVGGTLDTSFSGDGTVTTFFPGSTAKARDIAIQADGRIVAAGIVVVNNSIDFALTRYLSGDAVTPTPTPNSTPIACSIEFTDVPEGSTFYDFVRCMACQGIINGYTSGCETGSPCFRPNSNVTRGQLSKIVSNAAAFSEPAGVPQFEDVTPGSTFYDFVWRLADRGHVGGYACGGVGEPCGTGNLPYFRPNGSASRGQISKIVANAAGLSEPTGTQLFEDVLPSHTFYDFIQRLANLSVMGGYACGGVGEPCGAGGLPYFRPASNATRGQTSKIVANAFFPDCQTP